MDDGSFGKKHMEMRTVIYDKRDIRPTHIHTHIRIYIRITEFHQKENRKYMLTQ